MNKTTWQSPSNIALIKYWGKDSGQMPKNPSISFTLKNAYTQTTIFYHTLNSDGLPKVDFLFDGKENPDFAARLEKFIHSIVENIPILKGLHLRIESKNSFPHSTGIASSASAMSALALCLVSLEQEISGSILGFDNFYKKASFIARLGSGSAARSIYGGVTLWGTTTEISESSNKFAVDINKQVHPVFLSYQDAVLLVSDQVKKVSSSKGHELMENHPFAAQKYTESVKNTAKMLKILKTGNLDDFSNLVESEALSLHAMMMTSNPGYVLMEPNTLEIIHKIRGFRKRTNIPVCFTLDAGANVHVLYPETHKNEVKNFITCEIEKFCVRKQWIQDEVGMGPKKIN